MFIHPRIYALLDNPHLATIMSHSTYSLDEVKATLACAEQVGKEYDALVDQIGKIIDPIPWYNRTEKETALQGLMSGDPHISTGKQDEPFPLTQWQKAISSQRTHNRRIEKALKEFEHA